MPVITSDWSLDVWICASALALALYLYITRNANYWRSRGVKHLRPAFLFGNIWPCLLAKKTPYQLVKEVYDKGAGEKVMGIYVFGDPLLVLRDPELIKHVLIKDFSNFSNKITGGLHGDVMTSTNLFLASNPLWKNIRQKMAPAFSTGKLKKMYELMPEICNDLQNYLEKMNIDEKFGKSIDVKETCAKFTTDIIGTTAFGLYLNSLRDPEAEFRKNGREIFRCTFKRYLELMSIFFMPSLRPYTNAKFFDEKGSAFLKKTLGDVIDSRAKSGTKRSDVIDILVEIKESQDKKINSNGFKLEGDALVAQAAVFFSGGFETSSTTMTFGLSELARHPEEQTKLRNEILEALKTTGGEVTYEMVKSLPYLHMVTLETLRKYPILPFIDRIPERDYTFPGTNITVEKGVPVILPMRALHFDPQYFPNPEKFDPERFSEENMKNINPFTYFPFSQGPRNCIGAQLGYIQVKLGFIYFISKYELRPCSNAEIITNKLSFFVQPEDNVHLHLTKYVA